MEANVIILDSIQVVLFITLIMIAIIDVKEKTINRKFLGIIAVGSVVFVCMNKDLNAISAVGAMISIFALLSFVYFVSRKSIGWGDVLLCTCVAPYLGVERAFAMLFISMLCCGITALVLVTLNRGKKGSEIPFAPFAAVGTFLALFL